MGMFDYIHCHSNLLPGSFDYDEKMGFQTKDFDRLLDVYEIDRDSQLWRNPFDDSKVKKYKYPYTGVVFFYTHDKKNRWIEFKATFFEGKLQEIKEIK